MDLLLGCLAVLFIGAFVADRLVASRVIVALRSDFAVLTATIRNGEVPDVVLSAHQLFCRVFDAVYGQRIWSFRRLRRSCYFSLVFVFLSILVLGALNTFIEYIYDHYISDESESAIVIIVLGGFIATNLLADFISLQETRWILGLVRGRGLVKLGILVCVDLFLTTAIYAVVVFIFTVALYWILFTDNRVPFFQFVGITYSGLFRHDAALPFLVSTFGTSIVLFGFVCTALIIRLLSRSKVLRAALELVARSVNPAQSAAGILSVAVVAVFAVVETLAWVVGK